MDLKNLLLIIIAVFFAAGTASAQNQRHVITPADVLTIRELSDVQLSPNGKQILFVVNEPNDPKSPREPRVSNIWVVPADGRELPRALIPGLKSAGSPRWSPDGRTLAFLFDQERSTQIYLLRDGETKPSPLTNVPGGVEDYEWSPDGGVHGPWRCWCMDRICVACHNRIGDYGNLPPKDDRGAIP